MFPALRTSLRRLLPPSVKTTLRRARTALTRRNALTVWGPSQETAPRGRALLAYVQEPFRLYPEDPANFQFSNVGIARNLARALNDLGYVVDVVRWTDARFAPKKRYDLFLGHGGVNFERIAARLAPGVPKIYFATGLYWREHNRREEARFRWLEQRRGARLPPDRRIAQGEEGALRAADGVLCLGNGRAADSYRDFAPVTAVNNAVYRDDRRGGADKDFAAGRANFLFFSSTGNVHKGLDLLLEAFTHVEAHLYVCQAIAPEFAAVCRHELQDLDNVHIIGRIALRSLEFYDLMSRCNYVIHPSCAEGQPGSVLDCMHQGLIPVLSPENNIDTEALGVTLGDCAPGGIARVVRDLARRPPEWCREMSRRARQATLTDYSEAAFLGNVTRAVRAIAAQAKAGPQD